MKLTKSLIIPSVVFILSIFAAAYTITTQYEPLIQIFAPSLLDSMSESMPTQTSDVSQMFNERGFYKSNSYSFDENEIINDFNGNLMYEIPMYNFNCGGNLKCDVKLTYNGSVNHQIILAERDKYDDALFPAKKYNVSAPEWIVSVNGYGVQALNFETYLLTDPTSIAGDLEGNNVKKYY